MTCSRLRGVSGMLVIKGEGKPVTDKRERMRRPVVSKTWNPKLIFSSGTLC